MVDERAAAEPLAGTIFTPRQVRRLKIAVVVMGILLVGGFIFVLATILYQATRIGATDAGRASAVREPSLSQLDLPLPGDATVTQLALDGNRLAVHLAAPGGDQILLIDVDTGRVVARIRLRRSLPAGGE